MNPTTQNIATQNTYTGPRIRGNNTNITLANNIPLISNIPLTHNVLLSQNIPLTHSTIPTQLEASPNTVNSISTINTQNTDMNIYPMNTNETEVNRLRDELQQMRLLWSQHIQRGLENAKEIENIKEGKYKDTKPKN